MNENDNINLPMGSRSEGVNMNNSVGSETKKSEWPHKENTMQRTEISSLSKSKPVNEIEIQPEVSQNSSMTSSPDISESMNLIGDTAKQLQKYMKGMFVDQPDPDVRMYDPSRVQAAANVAKQIVGLMRVQLDATRLKYNIQKELDQKKGNK